MGFSRKRYELAPETGLTVITDKKFKTNLIDIRFITRLSDERAASNTLALSIISSCCAKYPTQSLMSRRLQSLYGSAVSSSSTKVGDNQVVSLHGSYIGDCYTMSEEKYSDKFLDLFFSCIFEPSLCGNGFEEAVFEQKKQNLLEDIDAQINSKRSYAGAQAMLTIFGGEPAAVLTTGNKQQAEALTPVGVYNAFCELLKTARIEIIFSGGNSDGIYELIRDKFGSVERAPVPCTYYSRSLPKSEPARVSEKMDVSQCNLVMALKSDGQCDEDTMFVLNKIFGGSTFSKLFMNVREKMSLCYFCSSTVIASKNVLFISSGIEKDNIAKAEEAILRQLYDIADGQFTDDDMKYAVISLENTLYGASDRISGLADIEFMQIFKNNGKSSVEDMINGYRGVTRDGIIALAKRFVLDTVYVLENDGSAEVE